ncbi:MAG: helicase-related protein [Litorivicinus sp.]
MRDSKLFALAKICQPEPSAMGWRGHPVGTLTETQFLIQHCMWICQTQLGMTPYWTQVAAALGLCTGRVVEMNTGEGKTLTGLLATLLATSQGWPVHVITANDYLAERDHAVAETVLDSLGITHAALVAGQLPVQRASILTSQVIFTTGKELVFEALRDRLALGDRRDPIRHAALRLSCTPEQRPYVHALGLAILDEADSVLIDEASTPCVISGQGGHAWPLSDLSAALELTMRLDPKRDLLWEGKNVQLSPRGLKQVHSYSDARLSNPIYRQTLVNMAVAACYRYQRDVDYVVSDNKIIIVDALTGRLMPDRRWEQGLHELIEVKEGLEPSQAQQTLGKMTYPQFFRGYALLSGMTGTAAEVQAELKKVYGLGLLKVAARLPSARCFGGIKYAESLEAKYSAVLHSVREAIGRGQSVLIGTPSIEQCEAVSRRLLEGGIPHQCLDGRQDGDEAEQVAKAGQLKQVTVSTAVAGRGTDIPLSDEVRRAGGLHVIVFEPHFSSRLDRQLVGRCARQGDPGSYEMFAAKTDSLLEEAGFRPWGVPSEAAVMRVIARQQRKNEKHAMRRRSELSDFEKRRAEWLPFLKQD